MCLTIFLLSSRDTSALSDDYIQNYIENKLAHVFMYFILCLTFYRATKNIFLAILLTIMYGVTDEVHQQFITNRTGQFSDVVIDGAGASLAGLMLWKFYQNLPKTLKNWLEV